jgi:hypothetical protein
MENVKCGLIRGTGSAENIDLGWTPDVVILWNHTDGDIIYIGAPQFFLCAFTSGGTTEVKKNALLEGATSGATGRVLGVMLDTGSSSISSPSPEHSKGKTHLFPAERTTSH